MTVFVAGAAGLLAAVAVVLLALDILWPAAAAQFWIASIRRAGGLRRYRSRLTDASLEYLDGGRGEPLLLVHGFGGDKDNFSLTAPFLTPHFRVIAPDMPGFGAASRDPTASYRIGDQVARLHEFVHQLGLGRTHLGGSSMGGFIAMQYAMTYPQDVASLWLLDPAGTQAAHDTAMMRHYLATGQIPLLAPNEAAYATLLEVATYRRALVPRSVTRSLARRAVADFSLHTEIFRQIVAESPLLEAALPALCVPTLLVWGAEDRVLNPAAASLMARLIPACRLVLMPGVGHLPMVERPRRAARDYIAFRANIDRAREDS